MTAKNPRACPDCGASVILLPTGLGPSYTGYAVCGRDIERVLGGELVWHASPIACVRRQCDQWQLAAQTEREPREKAEARIGSLERVALKAQIVLIQRLSGASESARSAGWDELERALDAAAKENAC